MTVGSHNFVKFTVIKLNCQNHSGCVFASGKNTMYPLNLDAGTDLFYLNFNIGVKT